MGPPRIADAIRRGRRLTSPRLALCVLHSEGATGAPTESTGPQAAWSIQKRFLKSAVLRNAVKRQLREALRHHRCNSLHNTTLVFMGRKNMVETQAQKRALKRSIRAEAESLLDRLAARA